MASRYTEAEIFEAVCCAVGDDGHRAKETLRILKQNRKSEGLICNRTYSLWDEDFARFLKISQIFANQAKPAKRFRPRARGRVGRITKPYSHITVIVNELGEGN